MICACGVVSLSASSKVPARSLAVNVCDRDGGPGWAPSIVYCGGRHTPSYSGGPPPLPRTTASASRASAAAASPARRLTPPTRWRCRRARGPPAARSPRRWPTRRQPRKTPTQTSMGSAPLHTGGRGSPRRARRSARWRRRRWSAPHAVEEDAAEHQLLDRGDHGDERHPPRQRRRGGTCAERTAGTPTSDSATRAAPPPIPMATPRHGTRLGLMPRRPPRRRRGAARRRSLRERTPRAPLRR